MTTLKSTSILASILAQNPYHIISIQGQMPMSHAQNTYDFEISTRKNMPRKSNITLTFSKNQKLFTLSLKILSTFSNPLSNEN